MPGEGPHKMRKACPPWPVSISGHEAVIEILTRWSENMTDPLTMLTAITSAVGLAKGTSDAASSTLDLVGRTRSAMQKDDVSAELMRLALLEVDHNLTLIDALRLDRLSDDSRLGLLQASKKLRHQALTALLLQWPSPEEVAPPRSSSTAAYQEWSARQDVQDKALQVLANARFIVSRASVLSCLGDIHPSALKRLRLGVRYRNLRASHLKLLRLLREQDAILHLLKRRAITASP